MADLIIKINGDLSSYESALEDAKTKTESLSNALESVSKISGVAFAAVTAEIALAVRAFGESQQASNSLTQALQNQGIYSDELANSYKEQSDELQKLTGIDNDAIVKAQSLLQGMIGNQEITYDLTKAIVDLSAAKHMDLDATAELIGKGIEGHGTALKRLFPTLDENLDKEGRTAQIIELVNTKFGDQATVANSGVGSLKGLGTAYDDLQKSIGAKFAPAVESVIKGLTSFFQLLKDHSAFTEIATSMLIAGGVVAGLALTVGLGGIAWVQYTAVMEAAAIATGVVGLATKVLVGATGLGLIIFILAEIYQNWGTIWPAMKALYASFVTEAVSMTAALGKIMSGVFTFDLGKIKSGLDDVKAALSKSFADGAAIAKTAAAGETKQITTQNAAKLALAKTQNAKEILEENNKQATLEAERALIILKLQDASTEIVAIKTAELDTLKQIADVKNASIRVALTAHLKSLKDIETLASADNIAASTAVNNELLAHNDAYQKLSTQQRALYLQQNQQALNSSYLTQSTAQVAFTAKSIKEDEDRHNTQLLKEQEFGTAYAAINALMHSKIIEGTGKATAELAQMQTSSNSTLKTIGKAAAIAQIAIKTGESAMNIFEGFSAIPFGVGIALGIAGAAAAVAFGAEQIGTVMAANQGGIVTGGIPGIDSVGALLTPGELVVPAQNFNEVVNSVSQSRMDGITDNTGMPASGQSNPNQAEIIVTLKDGLMDFIETKIVQRKRMGISILGSS